ncbi:MAG: molybdopterin molybdotransferase MoeA, partial [Chloroflexi bacterium]|nr:molybdopterin molybdotransferase MoeA [Chloroflexota bacterium]
RMDGYAVRSVETCGAAAGRPVRLAVAALIGAGQAVGASLRAGEAVAIATGAVLPKGADAVIPWEEVAPLRPAPPSQIVVRRAVVAWENVRRKGQSVAAGQRLLESGEPLGPEDVAVLATVGQSEVAVFPRVRVGILATGSELIPCTEAPDRWHIRSSNPAMLAVQAARAGAVAVPWGIVPDRREQIRRAVEGAVASRLVDFLVITGGAAAGTLDLTVEVLAELGQLRFGALLARPGAGAAFAQVDGLSVLALPGGPRGAHIVFELLARPALLRMAGRRRILRQRFPAVGPRSARGTGREQILVPVWLQWTGDGWQGRRQRGTSQPAAGQYAGLFLSQPGADWEDGTPGEVEVWDWPETEPGPPQPPAAPKAAHASTLWKVIDP